MRRGLRLLVVIPLLLLALRPGNLAAQSRLFDGASLLGRIAPDSPSAAYNFDASRGEHIALRVLGLNGLDPMATVRGPDGTDPLVSFDDAWSPEPGDSAITFNAPEGGAYEVIVAGENDSAGDFLLQFNQAPAGSTALLPGGVAVPAPVSAANGPLRLQFAARPDCPTVLVITPDGGPDFRALVQVSDDSGALIAEFGAGPEEKRLTVEADSGQYVAEIIPLDGSADGQVILTTACAAEQPACTAAPQAANALLPAVTPAGLLMVQPGGELTPGGALQGEIGQSSPMVGYTFDGSAGETLAVQVTGISLDFNPTIALLGPTLAQVATSDDSPGGFRASDALVYAVLPDDGRYTALVGSTGNLAGAFLIRLAEDAASAPIALSPDAPTTVDAAALAGEDGWYQRYTFSALDSCPTALDLQTASGSPLALGAVVRKAAGHMIGAVQPSEASGFNLVVPAGSGGYEVLIPRHGAVDELGQLTIQVNCQADGIACLAGGSPLFISTPTPGGPTPFATATLINTGAGGDVTGVVIVSSANVRRGDSQAFNVVRALPSGTEVDVIGVSDTGSGWFKIVTPQGEEGWMAPFVLEITGDIGSLPRLSPPAAPRNIAPTLPPVNAATVPPGSNAVCGNGWCEGNEATTCCNDCGTCGGGGAPTTVPPTDPGLFCGDGTCSPEAGEDYTWCSDCPAPFCGDGVCNGGENPCSCTGDCGFIIVFCNGNGVCECGESPGQCVVDCGF